ncbi:uncharacterized protein F4807DRAFT_466248 [Annulohypoxylon truncatum]|uniref:uncharacterized protein n=1 Tax=Annulohypoxylon truncatum TaxID=327061 RepID=UPI002008345B|nr:uncharacterized protein F4807DRAFT_466248 [Annulohypoxylon truncatum]KAI1214776.1 hypothetical protein F4807DRAFT_466248 [Annulohypoxylon truncatum]
MERSSVPNQTSRDTSDETQNIIYPFIRDGAASLVALNSHRRRLGLGSSTNLISSGTSQPEIPISHGIDFHHTMLHRPEEELFPFLNIINPTRPYNDLDNSHAIPEPTQHDVAQSSSADTENKISELDSSFRAEEGRNCPSSRRYRGNRALSRNRSADISNEMNCRLWISGLPPGCTISELLKEVRGVGPIYATHIVPPLIRVLETETKVDIPTSAASLTFFTASAAHLFLIRHTIHPFTVGSYTTAVSRHRIRTKPVPVDGQSRVLVITGDPDIVTPEKLTSLFTEKWNIRYETDFMEYTPGQGSNEIIWAFGSFRAQAEAVYIRLSKYPAKNITIRYESDPCA